MTDFICERIKGYSKKVVRVRLALTNRVVATFSFEADNTVIHSPFPYNEEQLEALNAARTFLEVGE